MQWWQWLFVIVGAFAGIWIVWVVAMVAYLRVMMNQIPKVLNRIDLSDSLDPDFFNKPFTRYETRKAIA